MNTIYNHLSRAAYHAGLVALRARLKQLTAEQVKAKSVLGVAGRNVSWREYSTIRDGKMRITALLNVYLYVRGKPPAHKPDKFPSASYMVVRGEAQEVFDYAVEDVQKAEAAVAVEG